MRGENLSWWYTIRKLVVCILLLRSCTGNLIQGCRLEPYNLYIDEYLCNEVTIQTSRCSGKCLSMTTYNLPAVWGFSSNREPNTISKTLCCTMRDYTTKQIELECAPENRIVQYNHPTSCECSECYRD